MADIGVLPSKTSISITSSNGENGTIPAATPRAAGCMTAEHAAQLDALYRASLTTDHGSAPIVIEAPARPVDAVSRGELRHAMAEVQRAIAVAQSTPMISHDASLSDRLAMVEARLNSLHAIDERVVTLATVVDQVLGMVDGLQTDQKFLERHAVAQVQVTQ